MTTASSNNVLAALGDHEWRAVANLIAAGITFADIEALVKSGKLEIAEFEPGNPSPKVRLK